MQNFMFLALAFCSIFNCQNQPYSHEKVPPSIELELVWETDTLLKTVETVAYDSQNEILYSANINGHFLAKDDNGSISTIDLNGNIIDQAWISGLNAPTGLWIHNNKLYTTDIDRIIEIDIPAGKINKTISIPGAKSLNDVSCSSEGVIYTTDTGENRIFSIKGDQTTLFMENIDSPNGLVCHNNQLLVSQWTPQSLGILDPENKTIQTISKSIPQADGVDVYEDKGYFASTWGGKVHYIAKDGTTEVILDTSEEQIQAADVIYIPAKKLLVVACFNSHKLMAYKVKV